MIASKSDLKRPLRLVHVEVMVTIPLNRNPPASTARRIRRTERRGPNP